MKPLVAALALLASTAPAPASVAWLLETAVPELHANESRRREAARRLQALGPGAEAAPAAELGYQLYPVDAPPLVAPWVQVDLRGEWPIDRLALVPAPSPASGALRGDYGFPRRFRADFSDDPQFRDVTPLADFTSADVAHDGPEPFVIEAGGRRARHVRLTVTGLAPRGQHLFFALAEIVVLSGNLNVAVGGAVTGSEPQGLPPAWRLENLTDGRMPLGPPVRPTADPHLTKQNGITASGVTTTEPAAMIVDLGTTHVWQEVRLFGMHSSVFGTPGLRFPESLLVEASADETFARSVVLHDSRVQPAALGGDPLTLRAPGSFARLLRVTGRAPGEGRTARFSLSEIQVYAEGVNVARHAPARAVPASSPTYRDATDLTDGRTSLGELLELPVWLEEWRERGALRRELATLAARRASLVPVAERRLFFAGAILLVCVVALATAASMASRLRQRRALAALRDRLARDLHDEIGSNLAGIAMLSEVAAKSEEGSAAAREDWREVRRIAQETTGAMREVLWLMGAREESGLAFPRQLELTAARLLRGHEIVWTAAPADVPAGWPVEARRNFLLTFKEALANVARHAGATRVELSARLHGGAFVAEIRDNGCGFPVPAVAGGGLGLRSIAERMRGLGGRVRLENSPGGGARVILSAPASPVRTAL